MAAALNAAWRGAAVILFERNAVVGRKLLVTGAGRCNITNAAVAAEKYTCADRAWMETLLGAFGLPELLAMLQEIGVPVYHTDDGWYYPLSESAQTVADAFESALQAAGVALRTDAQVTQVRSSGAGFSVTSGGKDELYDQVIVAAGGKAYPTLGSRGELFAALERFGHTVQPVIPALAPVLADLGSLHALQGMRLDVGVTLWSEQRRIAATQGNLIFTQWGLNGPAVMDISHHIAARPGAPLSLSLNLLEFHRDAFDRLLAQKRASLTPLRVFLGAFFPPKVAQTYLQIAHLPKDIPINQVEESAMARLIEALEDTRLPVKGVRGFEYCQVSAGGVPVVEVDPGSLESRLVRGLYLVGETLDVVGPCGGYNLQFAFSSGALAGQAAAGQA